MNRISGLCECLVKMKRGIIIAFVAMLPAMIFAQVKVSAVVCPQANENFGARIGADFDITLHNRWSFAPGVYWSLRSRSAEKSSEKTGSDGTTTLTAYHYDDKADFITVPLRMSLRIVGEPEGNFAMKLLFGPYVAYGIGGRSKCTKTVNGVESLTSSGAFAADGRYYSRWDYGLNMGVNFLVRHHFVVGVFSEMGFHRIYRPISVVDDIFGEVFKVSTSL
jgi:hypothetical protein